MAEDIAEIEKLAHLRKIGALTEEEFQERKRRALGRERNRTRWILAAIIGVLCAAGLAWSYVSFRTKPAALPVAPTAGLAVAQFPKVPATAQLKSDPVGVPPPALADAFAAAYPSPKVKLNFNGRQELVKFSPKTLVQMDASTFVLVSSGENTTEDCHACSGYYSLAYLGLYPELQVEGEIFTGSGTQGGWGNPPELQITKRLGPLPLLVVTSGYMGQGTIIESISVVNIGRKFSEAHVVVSGIETSYDDSGNYGNCSITGTLKPLRYGETFAISYTGTWSGRSVFSLSDTAKEDGLELYSHCPKGN